MKKNTENEKVLYYITRACCIQITTKEHFHSKANATSIFSGKIGDRIQTG